MLVNTYSGLSKYYSGKDIEKLKAFQEFAKTRHLYDPHFFLSKRVNFYQLMCNPMNKVTDIRIEEVVTGLVYSIHLVNWQIRSSKLLPEGACLQPDVDEIEDFVYEVFSKKILASDLQTSLLHKNHYLSRGKVNIDAINRYIKKINDTAFQWAALNWKNASVCQQLFDGLKMGKRGYVYGQRKTYKTKVITNKELEILRKFFRRGKTDEELFIKECETSDLKTTFNKWGKEKRFMQADIVMRLLGQELRSKSFKRFSKKVGVDFDKFLDKYAPDKRKGNGGDRRSAAFKIATNAEGVSTTRAGGLPEA